MRQSPFTLSSLPWTVETGSVTNWTCGRFQFLLRQHRNLDLKCKMFLSFSCKATSKVQRKVSPSKQFYKTSRKQWRMMASNLSGLKLPGWAIQRITWPHVKARGTLCLLLFPFLTSHYSWTKIRVNPKRKWVHNKYVKCNDVKNIYGNPGDCHLFSSTVQIRLTMVTDRVVKQTTQYSKYQLPEDFISPFRATCGTLTWPCSHWRCPMSHQISQWPYHWPYHGQ